MNYAESREVRGRQIPTFDFLEFTASLSPASVAANTAVARAMTFTGLLAGDIPLSLVKPTEQAGLNIGSLRVSGANTLQAVFTNATAAPVVPTAAETYTLTVRRTFSAAVGPGLS